MRNEDAPDLLYRKGTQAFILGAGFSKAVADAMPLTDELGRLALTRAHEQADVGLPADLPAGGFETWLSVLATSQPYLKPAENARNQGQFLLLAESVAQVLRERQEMVLRQQAPAWLYAFVSYLNETQSRVVTFNYDNLIEETVDDLGLLEPNGVESVGSAHVLSPCPPPPPGVMALYGPGRDSLRLHKLHGSLLWFWTSNDESGATIARFVQEECNHGFGKGDGYTDEMRQRDLPGRTTFVVPPTTSKSAFYSNPFMAEAWQQAREALRVNRRGFRAVFIRVSPPVGVS